ETFVEKVMKKVEIIKNWQLKNSKEGFEEFYREVLSDLEFLPDTQEKHYAMADVLMRGCWWIPGEKNDELLARIRENAEKGKNEDVISGVLSFERNGISGKERVDFMLEKQIPYTRALGFEKAEARIWFWLGYEYCRTLKDHEKGIQAFEKVLEMTTPDDVHYANAKSAIQAENAVCKMDSRSFMLYAIAEEYRIIDEKPRFWSQPGYSTGTQWSREDSFSSYVFLHASQCDHLFYDPELKLGQSYLGSDGKSSLTLVEDHATAKTACGDFYDCQVWETKLAKNVTYRTYYKYNIGIVRQECDLNGHPVVYILKAYHIAGGTGLLPFFPGNRWEFAQEELLDSKLYHCEHVHEILFFDGKNAVASDYSFCQRLDYDSDSWEDMMLKMRRTYWKSGKDEEESVLQDVFPLIRRVNELAVTPYQKLHTKVACDVMERILRTDEVFNPALTEKGHWNFFQYFLVRKEDSRLWLSERQKLGFEWKDMKNTGLEGYPLLHNHIYTILQDAFEGYLWDESFTVGTEKIIEQTDWKGNKIITTLAVKDAGTITTPAGVFENCILLDFHVKGRTGGWKYRGGKKEYYLAPGIGIVKAVNYYKERTRISAYELTAYQGAGTGYFPIAPGMFRRYENRGLENGFISSVEYYCTQDDAGNTVLMSNNLGIRRLDSTENIEESTKC
ncbi:MAG: hypothetical protein IJX62_10015, partial [Clostridia bacterium]|nr:hypothetical protein [Clostridia bacterium]